MTEDKSNKVQITVRIPDALKRALDIQLAKERRSQQGVFEALLSEYVGGKWDLLEVEPEPRDERNEKWHRLLDLVLTRGTKKQVEWLSGNLLTFAELIQLKGADLEAEADTQEHSNLSPEEALVINEFRNSSHEKRRRMLGFIAKAEDLGPEVMPSRKRGGGR